jgi:hypothetical protein
MSPSLGGMAMYSVNEGTTKKIFIEILRGVQLPDEYIVHTKVLPGGKQFSLLCGVPHYLYEEVYMQRRMGVHHNTSLAIFQAFDRFVIEPVLSLFPENSSFFEGSPQIIQLDEECVEGPVPYCSGNAKAKGVDKLNGTHHQYQSTMTFELTCVKKLRAKIAKPTTAVWGPWDRVIRVKRMMITKMGTTTRRTRMICTKLLFVRCSIVFLTSFW